MADEKAMPLVTQRTTAFYDLKSMLNIPLTVAQGYIIILANGSPNASALDVHGRVIKRQKSKDDGGTFVLGFLALTEGNVIDTCFGVSSVENRASSAMKQVAGLKSLLMAAANEDDQTRYLAVDTYRGSFEIVLQYQRKLSRLNWFTRCFRHRGLVRNARADLERAFEALNKTIGDCT